MDSPKEINDFLVAAEKIDPTLHTWIIGLLAQKYGISSIRRELTTALRAHDLKSRLV